MKIFNYVFTVVFLLFAALQYNDPDPVVWMLIYGAMTVTCALAANKIIYKNMLIVLAAAYLIYAALLFPSTWMLLTSDQPSQIFDELAKMKNIYIEEAREFFGLLICVAVLAINYFTSRSK